MLSVIQTGTSKDTGPTSLQSAEASSWHWCEQRVKGDRVYELQSSGPPLNRLSSEDSVPPKGGWTVWMAKVTEHTPGKQVKQCWRHPEATTFDPLERFTLQTSY